MTEEEGAAQSPDANSDKKAFGKDVGKLVSGTVVAQVVGIILIPIITRIFGPENFGVAAVFISIVSIIGVIACMRYELAILLPKDDKDAGAVFLLCLIILVCVSLVCIPVMFFCGDLIVSLLGNAAVKDYLFLVPVAVFIDGLYVAVRYWNTRMGRFGTQATTQVLQSVSSSGIKLGLGGLGYINAGSLIFGQILGNTIGTIVLLYQAVRCDLGVIWENHSLKNIRTQLIRYKMFPLIDSGSTLLNTVSWQLPVLMLTGFFSSTVAGLYALGFQMLQMPMGLVGRSIGQVFFQRASAAKHTSGLPEIVEETSSLLIILSIMPFLLLTIVGGDLFSLVFGAEWREAGIFVQILGVWAMVWFITSPLSVLINVHEILGFGLKYNLLNLVTRVLSLAIGGSLGNVYIALLLFMISGVFVYGYMGYVVINRSGASFKKIGNHVKKPVFIGLGICGMIAFISFFQIQGIVLCSIAIAAGIGYILFIIRKNKLVKQYLFIKG